MVDGLEAAAEMADLIAAAKEQEADRKLAKQDLAGAAVARAVAREMSGFSKALRDRAASINTGDWRPIGGDPGPGWRRRRRAATPPVGAEGSTVEPTRKVRVRRRKSVLVRLGEAFGKWFS